MPLALLPTGSLAAALNPAAAGALIEQGVKFDIDARVRGEARSGR
jgi:hypothetical protein